MSISTERKARAIDLSHLDCEAPFSSGQSVPEFPSDNEDDEEDMQACRAMVLEKLRRLDVGEDTEGQLGMAVLDSGTKSVKAESEQSTAKSSKTSVMKGWEVMTDLNIREPVGTNDPWPRDETKTVDTTASTSTRGKSNTKRGGRGRGKRGGRGGGTSRGDSNNDFYTRSKCGESSRGSSAGGRGSY